MAYQKTQWKDHIEGVQVGTPVNAVNMNKIEDGIAQAHLISRLDTLWEGSLTADNTTISLAKPITDYRMLIVVGSANQYTHYGASNILPVGTLQGDGCRKFEVSTSDAGFAVLFVSLTAAIRFRFASSTSLISISGFSESARLTGVYGIK